uniref:N-alpha-acetyltransferase 15, NatA auxiliary subunit n=1 Tax=Cacopsylla melanoneura TaxID=428564 RepID=A0A8D8ZZN1_9HEMI
MPSCNPLPPKENSLFKRILKCYEHKQYKNGLKFAKQILTNPKYTEHGETLAMKGLTLNCLGRKEEAYEYVRRGLRNDLKSHVCWHVYGLLQRSDKKYDEAIKCYRNALKWEHDNIQIMRDLSLLQIQMRDLEGYRETRSQLFMLRPTQRASWIGFAMAYHLLNDFDMACNILEAFRKTQQVTNSYDFEHSELLLYQSMVIQESGDLEEAVKHLDKFKEQIHDKLTVEETYGDLKLKLGQYLEAMKHYESLIERNQENTLYYNKLIEAKQLTNNEAIFELLTNYISTYPKATVPKRLVLNYLTGDQFRTQIDKYLRRGFHKGVPPLFVNLRSLYSDPERCKIIQELVESYVEALSKTGHFSLQDEGEVEPASALLWVYHYLAQHYDHLGDTMKALGYINDAIDHTPTLIELFVTKGRIYKHAGDVLEAYKWLDEAQSLDTADRYINSKCAKYMLRANLIKEAEETCSKFTREGVSAMENLNEMQCMWFQTECALAYQRQGRWGDTLKKCHEIDRHFSEIIEDQFDFHTYCMRKMTLRSYVRLLRLEDVLRAHPFYYTAARCAIQVYLRLYDRPCTSDSEQEQQNTENLLPGERKKLLNKQKKAKRKELEKASAIAAAQEKREQHNKARQATTNQDNDTDTPQQDELIPEKLAKTEEPLEMAIKFLSPLQVLGKDRIETHLMAFEIYFRRKKPLLMLQSIKRAWGLDPTHPTLHTCLIRLAMFLDQMKGAAEDAHPAVWEVLNAGLAPIMGSRPALELNAAHLKENGNHLPALFCGYKMLYLLDPSKQSECISNVTRLDQNLTGVSLTTCTEIFESLKSGIFGTVSEDVLDSYSKECSIRFPLATIFKSDTTDQTTDSPAATNDMNHVTQRMDELSVDINNCQDNSVSN